MPEIPRIEPHWLPAILREIREGLSPHRQPASREAMRMAADALENVERLRAGLGMLSTEDTAEGRFAAEWYENLSSALGFED